jgi:hypothetical protein
MHRSEFLRLLTDGGDLALQVKGLWFDSSSHHRARFR